MIDSKSKTAYINGLKGFACIMVMLGHFIGIYKYAESFPADSKALQLFDVFLNSKLGFLLDESFWVILFFFVSGYLVSFSKISDITDFIYKSVMRFVRLALPILFASIIIFVIQESIGFHTVQTVGIFESLFVQKYYSGSIPLWQALKSPVDVLIFGKSPLCSPYWVLREMLISSILIYLLNLLKNKININLFFAAWGIAVAVSMVFSNIIFAGLFGMTLNLIQNDKERAYISNKIFLFAVLAFSLSLFVIPRSRIAPVFFCALILIVPEIKICNFIFSCRLSQFINRISFGIYSFHWPVFCSVGMLVIIKTHADLGLTVSAVFAALISATTTLLLSFLYYHIFEKQVYKLLKHVDNIRTTKYKLS